MMPKPIFIIVIPGFPPQDKLAEIRNRYNNQLAEDYHVIVLHGGSSGYEFKMFSDKEIEPIELEKLKELLKL